MRRQHAPPPGRGSMLMAGLLPRSRRRPRADAPRGWRGWEDRVRCRGFGSVRYSPSKCAGSRTNARGSWHRAWLAMQRPASQTSTRSRPDDDLDVLADMPVRHAIANGVDIHKTVGTDASRQASGRGPPGAGPARAATPVVRHARSGRSAVRWWCRGSVDRRPRRSTVARCCCRASNVANDRPARALCLT